MTQPDGPPGNTENAMWRAYNDFHHLCDTARMQKLFARHRLFLRVRDIPGDIVDAGVFKGTSTILFAQMLRTYCPDMGRKVVGFDTFDDAFEGTRNFEQDNARSFMQFHEAGMEAQLNNVIRAQQLENYCELIKGDITKTLPAYLGRKGSLTISLLHVDLDIYEPTISTLRNAYDAMAPGGLIVLDQYGIEGWGETAAVDDFFAERGIEPTIERIPFTTTPTALIQV